MSLVPCTLASQAFNRAAMILRDKDQSTMTENTWKNQFGEEYAVPTAVLNQPNIVDMSWGNDAAPAFTLRQYQRDGDLPQRTLWVEHPDKAKREYEDWHRFVVVSNPEHYETSGFVDLYNGNDVNEALKALEGVR